MDALSAFYNLDSRIKTSEVEEQISYLEKRISSALITLRVEQHEFSELENQLSNFLEAYLAEVGSLFEELKDVTAQINYYSERIKNLRNGITEENSVAKEVIAVRKIKKSIESAINNQPFSENDFKEKELKNTYRKIAKFLNETAVKGEKNSLELFQIINKLYNEKNLDALIRIEREIFSGNKKFASSLEKLEFLEVEYEAVLSSLDKVRISRHKLVNSPTYELMQKFKRAEKTGQNLVSEVMKEVLTKIKERRKELLQKITYYKFLTASSFEVKTELTSKIIQNN